MFLFFNFASYVKISEKIGTEIKKYIKFGKDPFKESDRK